ncbi:FliI/YscN family ATPase [Anaeromyxobacter oryzisoli]|uniref:FliI/YscN family ATPase n=1 Tax=Anaeromyxobacter oryzisoli TaxID=2925408 RepID=UPI001F589E94|nr:FliI/YscN family ATPase [Anaeromyxobacter sp. SG63]
MTLDLLPLRAALDGADPLPLRGRVTRLTGMVIEAAVAGVRTGDVVEIARPGRSPLLAEVVGLREDRAVVVPLGEPTGVGADSEVVPTGAPLGVHVGEALLGRVLDGLGRPADGLPLPPGLEEWPVERPAPAPLSRRPVSRPLALGIRALDGLLTVGEGQRLGLFAGSGVGKSTLLAQVARGARADVSVVCLVGERGREVREFVDRVLGPEGLARSVLVVATSDAPALVRLRAAHVATAVAEWFADRGRSVLFLLDSVTRYARALREVGLAAGEPPARQGYPASVFAALPRLLERTGNRERGAITALYTVLVAGGDMEEPIADEVRGILDGHVVLERRLAAAGRFPAVDPLQSVSRVMPAVVAPGHLAAAARLRALLAAHERVRDLVALGAYRAGADADADAALARLPEIEGFLRQGADEATPLEETVARLEALVR